MNDADKQLRRDLNVVPKGYKLEPDPLPPEMTAKPPKEPELTKYTDENGKTVIAEVLAVRTYENSKGKVRERTALLNTNIDQETGKRKGRPNEVEAKLSDTKSE